MITAAAIKLPDGTIWTGHRHHNILGDLKEAGIPRGTVAQSEQGFVDQNRRFLNRKEAGQHAVDCGQVEPGCAQVRHEFNPRLGLFSEDLW